MTKEAGNPEPVREGTVEWLLHHKPEVATAVAATGGAIALGVWGDRAMHEYLARRNEGHPAGHDPEGKDAS